MKCGDDRRSRSDQAYMSRPNAINPLSGIFPSAGFLATCNALNAVYRALKQRGDAEDGGVDLFSFGEFNDLMGFNDIVKFEEQYN